MLKRDILNDEKWKEYLQYKIDKDFLTKKDLKELSDFILNKKYLDIAEKIYENQYVFSTPKKHIINKSSSRKKRIVYTYTKEEMIILKYISFLLYKYDYLFSHNLYSFRKNRSVKTAITNISNIKNISNMYGYKVDIQNYFNSIDINILLSNLKKDIDDKLLYELISRLLLNNKVIYNKREIIEQKGVMAGTPISAFLANYYIKEIDEYFWNEKIVYFRYADDIIIFANTKEDLNFYIHKLQNYITMYNLKINKDKEFFFDPKDKCEFLGFSFENNHIDISSNSVKKIKAKIRRSARSFRRWMLNKNVQPEITIKTMIKRYNQKFYGNDKIGELSWKYWFFPTITTDKSLKIIDEHMQKYLRYIYTGKHNKRNYKIVPYDTLKLLGYRPLVHEYYKLKSFNVEDNM